MVFPIDTSGLCHGTAVAHESAITPPSPPPPENTPLERGSPAVLRWDLQERAMTRQRQTEEQIIAVL